MNTLVGCFSEGSFDKFIRYMRTNKIVIAVIDIDRIIHKRTKSNRGLIKLRENWKSIASVIIGIANPKMERVCTVVTPFLDSIFVE